MVRRLVAVSFVGAAAFAFGFCFAGWIVGEGIKDGSLDDAIDEVRARRRRMMFE